MFDMAPTSAPNPLVVSIGALNVKLSVVVVGTPVVPSDGVDDVTVSCAAAREAMKTRIEHRTRLRMVPPKIGLNVNTRNLYARNLPEGESSESPFSGFWRMPQEKRGC